MNALVASARFRRRESDRPARQREAAAAGGGGADGATAGAAPGMTTPGITGPDAGALAAAAGRSSTVSPPRGLPPAEAN
ncbi:MAG TPA: hypothetical protein VLE45_15790, partial [Burkholderiaceae bacterium]|nr:hypothetical protein [Burkholderiaceae bacterium]